MSFEDLDRFYKIQPKKLPIKGKTYSFPGSVSARTGLLLHRMTEQAERARGKIEAGEEVDLDESLLDDGGEIDLRREVLGDAEAKMIADGVPAAYVEHAFHTLIAWHQFGEDIAKAVWEDVPGAPKAPEDRKPKSQRATGASGSTTKRAASTKSTSESTPASAGDES